MRAAGALRYSPQWGELAYQRAFLDKVGSELGVKELSGWYKIKRQEVAKRGGQGLFSYYPSLEYALRTVYPEFPWQSESFASKKPHHYWQNTDNLLDVLNKAEKEMGITQPEDWNSVTLSDLRAIGFPTRVSKLKLAELLEKKYPNHSWDKVYILRGRYSQQKRFQRAIATLFPNENIDANARTELKNVQTGYFLEIDIYLPSLRLAFEFQEKHHFVATEYLPLEKVIEKDAMKVEQAKEKGITLIAIPFWWDGQLNSLAASIRKHRPDLLQTYEVGDAMPIPDKPPSDTILEPPSVVDIGQPITACFLTGSITDPTNWWLFEKYDGIRGFWNPLKKAFFSRVGNQFSFPPEVISSMPADTFLDGEIWFGRDNFTEATKVYNRMEVLQIKWDDFKFMVFDIPNHPGTYEERYSELVRRIGEGNKYLKVAPKEICKGMEHMNQYLQDILDGGGEGIILRDPQSPYIAGRSLGYLKHKKYRDSEAKVIGPAGPNQWECELPNGVRFVAGAGTSEFLRRCHPQPGDIVAFKHKGYLFASKKPKSPSLYRIRTDLSWENVLQNWKEKKPAKPIQDIAKKKVRHRPQGYWLFKENRRDFFINFAKEKGFDPYIPENWAKITTKDILAQKGQRLLVKYKNSIADALADSLGIQIPAPKTFKREREVKTQIGPTELKQALQRAYPEIQFSRWNVNEGNKKVDRNALRQIFNEYAKEKQFDPTQPDNWYSLPYRDVEELCTRLNLQLKKF